MVQKAANCVLYELKERNIGFLHRIITGDVKWIHYCNIERKPAWVKRDELGPSMPKAQYLQVKGHVLQLVPHAGRSLLQAAETINSQR
ncbi:hypothetical protein Trydic_g17803 [Trypoxylus dichotomus]